MSEDRTAIVEAEPEPRAVIALSLERGRAELKLVDDGETLILTVPDGWGFRALYPASPERGRRFTTIFLDKEDVGYGETRGPDRGGQ
jgi:hypothetical protein